MRREVSATGPMGKVNGLSPQDEVGGKFAGSAVDKAKSRSLYSAHNGAPPAFRRDGAPAKLLTDQCDQSSDFGRKSRASAASRRTGKGDRHDPRAV